MQNLGMLLLAIYLIVVGVLGVTGLHFMYDHIVVGVLAVVTGVLLILKK